jgi:hypothetical protein
MADIAHPNAMLVVPNGTPPLHENFITFLWDRELAAYLVKNPWVPKLEERGSTAYGVLVHPGTC